jgi:hypothetical protein
VTSDGTSSTDPTLPSTTDALRRSPRSFVRFIGEFLNAAENSACDMDSSESERARASMPASAARGANAGSDSSCANFRLYGHTSWDVSRCTRFKIPLATGRRTLRDAITQGGSARCMGVQPVKDSGVGRQKYSVCRHARGGRPATRRLAAGCQRRACWPTRLAAV